MSVTLSRMIVIIYYSDKPKNAARHGRRPGLPGPGGCSGDIEQSIVIERNYHDFRLGDEPASQPASQ